MNSVRRPGFIALKESAENWRNGSRVLANSSGNARSARGHAASTGWMTGTGTAGPGCGLQSQVMARTSVKSLRL
jgi:hypothetical protein